MWMKTVQNLLVLVNFLLRYPGKFFEIARRLNVFFNEFDECL